MCVSEEAFAKTFEALTPTSPPPAQLVELVLTRGMTPSACLGFVWFGFVASSTFGDLAFGSQMTHFATDLAQHPLSSASAKGQTLTLSIALAAYASPLKEARQTVQAATRVRQCLSEQPCRGLMLTRC